MAAQVGEAGAVAAGGRQAGEAATGLPEPNPRQTPRTVSTPAKPRASPASPRGPGRRSPGTAATVKSRVNSGVAAFITPASTEPTLVSP
ncbi:hypothetical protein ACFQ0M_34695 [Kitasatospora aburaviensis]